MSNKHKPKGRPQGSPNVTTTQLVRLPQCPSCKTTDRGRYYFVSAIDHGGITADGYEYSHVVRRRTTCAHCGQTRIDKFLENSAPAANPGDENEPTEPITTE